MDQDGPEKMRHQETILNSIAGGLVLLGPDGNMQYCNSKAFRLVQDLLGFTLHLYEPFEQCISLDHNASFTAAFHRAVNGVAASLNIPITKREHHQETSLSFQFYPAANGGVVLSMEQHQKNNGLSFDTPTQKYVDLMLANMKEGFLLVDHNLRVQAFNAAAAKRVEQVCKKRLEQGISILAFARTPESADRLRQDFEAVLIGNGQEKEYHLPFPEGVLSIKINYQPAYDASGAIAGCLVSEWDVTLQHKKQNVLADNEQRWRFALEGSNQGVWDWDIRNDHVIYSAAWFRMFGYEEGEVGHSMKDYEEKLHPEDQEKMRHHRFQHFHGPEALYESEFRLRDAKGHFRWVLSRGMIMDRDAAGAPLRMIGTHTDITNRKVVEEKYKVLFYKNPIPMWIYDRESLCFLDINEAAVQQYGYTAEEFRQMSILDIRPPEDRQKVRDDIRLSKLAQSKPSQTWRHCKKDGTLIWVNITAFTFQENHQTITLVTAEDVTLQIAAEERLRASEAYYRHLFRSIPLPAFIYDPQTLAIRESNDRAISLYGYTARELGSMNVAGLHERVEDESVLRQVLNQNNKGHRMMKWLHRTKAGNHRKVELWASGIGMDGNHMRLLIINDITEKETTEAELRASSERFRYVMNATNDIVWDWQVGSDRIIWSNHYHDILGWQLPEDGFLPYSQLLDCLHPDDKERVLESLNHSLYQTKDALWENAFRYLRSDGSYAYILDKAFILRDGEGKAYRMIGAMHDISFEQYQQEVQELELRIFALSSKPETKIQQVLENISGGLEQLHPHLRVCVINFSEGSGVKIVARRLPPRLHTWVTDFLEQHKNKWVKSPLRKGLTTHSLELADRNLLTAEWGDFEPRQVLSLPAINNDGSLMASLLVFIGNNRGLNNAEWNALYRLQNLLRLLLVQHNSVEQIRLANERFDNVLKATHDLIWDWDLQTGIFYRSPEALKRLYGVVNEHEISNVHDWIGRIHEEDQAKVQQIIEKILSGKVVDGFDVEYRFLKNDGTFTYLYDRGIIIRNPQGQPVRMIGAAQDISDRKELEQELLQQELDRQRVISQATIDTQEQERAEIGRELHDNVNQILTTTKLYLELAQSNHDMTSELVVKSSKNIIHVINEIRQLSRSLMDPSIGDLGLSTSIRDLAENINLTRKINIKLALTEALDDQLDESRKLMVFRIIQEAMSNIIRHAKATEVMIKLRKSGKQILLQVTDNGIGFEPEGVRSGIGLKNIRNRVFLVNGSLQIVSAPGQGTTLKILFPLPKSSQ